MAFSNVVAFLAFLLLLLQPPIARSDFLAPIFNDVCKQVVCGKGTCKPSKNSTFSLYECECEPGWKQVRSAHDNHLKFLPCIVPNCSLNYSCMKTPSPVQEKSTRANESIIDPCYWTDCGGGSCNKTSMFSYKCECDAGYYNLLNTTAFPCYKECATGVGCSDLGIPVANNSPPVTNNISPPVTNNSPRATPALNDNASWNLQGSLWLATLVVFMAIVQWKWEEW
ncbi:Neurogenic locus notch-like protein [Quillaja saponaria]|uniref:Neurogenic locus notch-like protein n=1 Tax=Quillaja saponaria TaxID=32244 RepID=A0AAD7LBV8_QUISA|nr:Neurogenic locus notch-like protein [Quillaja saponaria]